ncbi:uncharacterized protein BDV14DRAFT_162253 [Aspergillus stella-maris]|uniref:uncharacterized protein n=1 Tax=Aspergillus stella-maris TaxID=1810926 RepID=UPI003CCDF9C0
MCRELKSFRMIFDKEAGPLPPPNRFQQALQLHKSSLERLWLSPWDDYALPNRWVGPLTEFTALKVLCISLQNLCEENDNWTH